MNKIINSYTQYSSFNAFVNTVITLIGIYQGKVTVF